MDSAILREEALKLPAFDRAQLADSLISSLEDGVSSQTLEKWAAEAEERNQAFEKGAIEGVEGESLMNGLRKEFKG